MAQIKLSAQRKLVIRFELPDGVINNQGDIQIKED